MSESTLMDYLNKCQHLQRESQESDMVIDYSHQYKGFVVTIRDHKSDKSERFDFTDWYTDAQAEELYGELHNTYTRIEGYDK